MTRAYLLCAAILIIGTTASWIMDVMS